MCAKALKQDEAALASFSFSTLISHEPRTPVTRSVSCALPSSCLVVPPVPEPPGSDSRDTSSGKSSIAHQATWPLTARCPHNTMYASSLWCLSFLKILVCLAFPLNSEFLECKDQSLLCFCFVFVLFLCLLISGSPIFWQGVSPR